MRSSPERRQKPAARIKRRARIASARPESPRSAVQTEMDLLTVETPSVAQMRQQLEEAERHYQMLYDSSPVGYVTLDNKALIREVNLPAARLLEMDRDQLFDLPFTFLIPSEDLTVFLDHLRRCRAGSPRVISHLHVRTKRLERVPVQLISVPLIEQFRAVYRTAIIELRPAASPACAPHGIDGMAQSICDAVRQPVALVDEGFAVHYVNRAFAEAFSLVRGETKGRSFFSLIDPSCDDRALREQLARAMVERRNVEDFLLECEVASRGKRFFRLDARFVGVDPGSPPLILVALDDLMERVQKQEKSNAEQFFDDVLRHTPVALHCATPEGDLLWANQAELDLLGYSAEEYVGHNLREFHEDPGLIEEVYRRLFNHEPVAEWEASVRCKDGTVKRLLICSNALWKDGRLIQVRCGSVDVTRRAEAMETIRKLNEELEARVHSRTTDLQQTRDELEAFCYAIAHDLRAPLRALEGFSQALLEDYGPNLDTTACDYLRRIIVAAQREDLLIQDLISYTQLKLAPIALAKSDLNDVMGNVLAALEAEIEERRARVEIAPSLPAVLGNIPMLDRVFLHLIRNALKFVAPGESPIVVVRAENRGKLVRVWVEDHGIGIAPEHHQRIFHVFERLHPKHVYPGTGIGLAIVRKAVERMGGRSGVESQLGEGSRFWIELGIA